MKKIAAILLTLLLIIPLCLSFTACEENDVGPLYYEIEIPEEGFLADQDITITFTHTMGAALRDVLDQYIVEFNKIYPKIHIEHNQGGGYDDLVSDIRTMIATGDPETPNIVYCYPDHVAAYNEAGGVVGLDNLINSQIKVNAVGKKDEILGLTDAQKKDFIPGYYAEGSSFGNEHMYLLPFSKSTELMYYNKTFFEENHLEVPDHWFANSDNDTTSLEYVCKKIKEIGGANCVPLGYDSESNLFITMCEQMGSGYTSTDSKDHYIFNNKENRDMLNKFRQWYQAGLMTTKALNGDAYTSKLFVNVNDSTSPRSYISIGSSAGATNQRPAQDNDGNYAFEVGIAPIPQVDKNNPKVISQGPDVCILKNEDPQKVLASWLFIKFLTTDPVFQADFANAQGYAPVIASAYSDPILADKIKNANGGSNIVGLSINTCRSLEKSYFTSAVFTGSSNSRVEVGNLVVKVLNMNNSTANIEQEIEKAFEDCVSKCRYVD